MLNKRLDVLYQTLNKPGRWYTGLSIKKILNQNVFALQQPEFKNPAIESGRWSAYVHFDMLLSFRNLLEKHEIDQTKIVLVHPLLPTYLVEELLSRHCKLVTIDIDRDTLSFDPLKLQNYLRLLKTSGLPDLVIHYAFNGLYEPVTQSVDLAHDLVVPSMIVVNNSNINSALLELFEHLTLGSVLWFRGENFWINQLDASEEIKKSKVTEQLSKVWYWSWYIETRTRSILEHHLSTSQDEYTPLVMAYFYLLNKERSRGSLQGALKSYFTNQFINSQSKIKNSQEALNILSKAIPNTLISALPDMIFDLQSAAPVEPQWEVQDMAHTEALWQSKAQILRNQAEQFQQGDENSEIPELQLGKAYLQFFIYTTDIDKWVKRFDYYSTLRLSQPHQYFMQKQNLPELQFIYEHIVLFDIVNSLVS